MWPQELAKTARGPLPPSAELAVQLNEEIHDMATLESSIHDSGIPFHRRGMVLLQLPACARTVASCSRFQISSTHSQCSGFISTDRRHVSAGRSRHNSAFCSAQNRD